MADGLQLRGLDNAAVDRALAVEIATRLDRFVQASFQSIHHKGVDREAYLEPMCFALQQVLDGATERLLLNVPPRHLKSFAAAVCLPAFSLIQNPELKVGVVSYSQELAREHSAIFNRLIQARWFERAFPHVRFVELTKDKAVTREGGGRKSITVSGSFTGMGVDILVLDDLIKASDASSPIMREEVERFYRETALTRFNDQRKVKLISIQQRLHVEDLASSLIERGGFKHLRLPSYADKDIELPCYNGRVQRWQTGDLLSPVRFPKDALEKLRTDMGAAAFSAQYLQDPLPDGSMIVDVQRLHFSDEVMAPESLQFVAMSIDTAVKDHEHCDYSVITVWGYDGQRWGLLDLVRGRFEFPELKGITRATSAKWKANRIMIEDSHTGSALWQEIKKDGAKVVALRAEGSKIERLSVGVGRLYSGEIVFPRNASFIEPLISELRAFPNGRHDDIVDSVSQFLVWNIHRRMPALVDATQGVRHRRRGRRA